MLSCDLQAPFPGIRRIASIPLRPSDSPPASEVNAEMNCANGFVDKFIESREVKDEYDKLEPCNTPVRARSIASGGVCTTVRCLAPSLLTVRNQSRGVLALTSMDPLGRQFASLLSPRDGYASALKAEDSIAVEAALEYGPRQGGPGVIDVNQLGATVWAAGPSSFGEGGPCGFSVSRMCTATIKPDTSVTPATTPRAQPRPSRSATRPAMMAPKA